MYNHRRPSCQPFDNKSQNFISLSLPCPAYRKQAQAWVNPGGRHLIILKDRSLSASIAPSYPLDFLIKKHYEGT
jgi:hypothetical protein